MAYSLGVSMVEKMDVDSVFHLVADWVVLKESEWGAGSVYLMAVLLDVLKDAVLAAD
eukprot:CAMPEP_0170118576 /NCGR_PEP_ID=MMETSP0020_2-20130122/13803_1 /TAXON_ID=98059 /ORGANISM="Dinobryon sp., Strain UTEXLB2267" /LENGTH=56 /DNA_ID=CAMNT_0010347623 /DNA_START=1833 /DNA_END=2003 /DNA_ORIENTATION=+